MEVKTLFRISERTKTWMDSRGIDIKTLAHLKSPEEENYDDLLQRAWDDVTGKELSMEGVIEARMREISHIRDKKVWVKIPRWKATQQGWKIIGTRWIDINKGDSFPSWYFNPYSLVS